MYSPGTVIYGAMLIAADEYDAAVVFGMVILRLLPGAPSELSETEGEPTLLVQPESETPDAVSKVEAFSGNTFPNTPGEALSARRDIVGSTESTSTPITVQVRIFLITFFSLFPLFS